MSVLSDIFLNKKLKYCDKWENYLGIYEREMAHFVERGEPISILEIGVQNGGSLELWAEYLPLNSSITGVDINPSVADLTFSSEKIKALSFDATDPIAADWHFKDQSFDIIIDDGSHKSNDIIKSFNIYFNRLKAGGLYIVEDLHCSYLPEFDGGYQRAGSSIEYLKGLVDVVNCTHISEDEIDKETLYAHRVLMRSLASVSFYDSICVIEKLKTEKARPYRRIISGENGEVIPLISTLIDERPRYVFDHVLFGRAALSQANPHLLARTEMQAASIAVAEERLAWVMRESKEIIEALKAESAHAKESSEAAAKEIQRLQCRIGELNEKALETQAAQNEIFNALKGESAALRLALTEKDAHMQAIIANHKNSPDSK